MFIDIGSVARLGGFTPNWATLKVIGLVKIALGGHVKIGLVFTHWAGKNSLGREPKFGLFFNISGAVYTKAWFLPTA